MLGGKKEAQEKNFLGEKIAKSKTYLAQNQTMFYAIQRIK